MKFQVQLVPVTQVCLDISFAFKFSFFLQQPSKGAVLEVALEVCSESMGEGETPVPGCYLNKVAK